MLNKVSFSLQMKLNAIINTEFYLGFSLCLIHFYCSGSYTCMCRLHVYIDIHVDFTHTAKAHKALFLSAAYLSSNSL